MQPQTYHRFSRYLHWGVAALIFYMVFLGWTLEDKDVGLFSRYQLHKSVGFLILLLTFVRIGLRLVYKAPPEMQGPKAQMWAARAVHIGFYVLMIGLPLSGWALVSTAKVSVPTIWFGVLPVPHLPLGHELHDLFENLHGILAKAIFYVLIPLHVGAALMHHFVHKDETIVRMLPGLEPRPSVLVALKNPRWLVLLGVVIGAFILATFTLRGSAPVPEPVEVGVVETSEASSTDLSSESSTHISSATASDSTVSSAQTEDLPPVPAWAVDKSASHIRFATTFQGSDIKGGFGKYSVDITFDPNRLVESETIIIIDLASVNTSDPDRDGTLISDSFFGVAQHPKAVFEAKRFIKTGENTYVAKGKLTLHGKTRAFDLPFTLKISGKSAVMTATAKLNRLDYGVGSGEWASTDSIPAQVALDIKVSAKVKE